MSLTGNLIVLISGKSARRFEQASLDPERIQQDKLLWIIQRNKNTEYGKKHGFDSIKKHDDYRRNVPVITYEDIRADMDRVLNGEKNVFTAEDPVMFAQTSGTTGDPKFIPVTPTDHGREHKDVMRTWLYHCSQAHPDIFNGKVVTLVSPAVEGYCPSGIPYGSTSGHMYRNMPGFVRRTYAIPYCAFEIEDYKSKYYAIMRIGIEQDVTLLCSANPSSILKMCKKGDEFSESIIRDIRDGSLSKDFVIEPEIRRDIERSLRANPSRAQELERMRQQRDGSLKPADYWPNLALIGCWKGGTVGHYIEKFEPWTNPDGRRRVPVRDWGYLASELRGSVPLSDEGSQGALTIATNFFEFVEPDDVTARPDDPSSWNFLSVSEIKDNTEYYIFATTTGGLYRYDINDIVCVRGFYHKNPQIEFIRKGRGMTNLTGEKLSVNQIIEAFDRASEATSIIPNHFKAEADSNADRYVFRMEPLHPIQEEAAQTFLAELDSALKQINLEYKAKRESMRLKDPVMHVMREGWHDRDRRAQVDSGKRQFQAKTEILSAIKQPTQKMRPEIVQTVEFRPQH